MPKWLHSRIGWIVIGFSLVLALAYSLPWLAHHNADGVWDWSEAVAHYEASRQTVFYHQQFPLWNPYVCGGAPAVNNPQSYYLSGTFLLALMFGSVSGPKIAIALYLFAGAVGTIWLARKLGITGPASLLAAPIYLTSGFMTVHLSGGQYLWLTLAYIPWVCLSLLWAQKNRWWLLVGVFCLAMIGIEGRSYGVAYTVLLLLIVAAGYDLRAKKFNNLINATLLIGGAFLFGAWKFVPDLYFLSSLNRSLEALAVEPWWWVLQRLWVPELALLSEDESIPLVEYGFYVGWIPLVLAAAAVVVKKTRSMLAPWLAAGAVLTLVAIGPTWLNVFELLPVTSALRNPQRALGVVLLMLGIAAAAGLWYLVGQLKSVALRRVLSVVVVAVVVFDLLIVAWPVQQKHLIIPEGDGEAPPPTYPFVQTDGIKPFPTVRQRRGATGFCPAVLQAWQPLNKNGDPTSAAVPKNLEDYEGEVFVAGGGSAKYLSWSPNKLVIEADVVEGRVVVNQNWADGWHSTVGEVVRADDNRLAVQLPAGQHQFELSYTPPGWRQGWALTIAFLLGVFGLGVWSYLKNKRKE